MFGPFLLFFLYHFRCCKSWRMELCWTFEFCHLSCLDMSHCQCWEWDAAALMICLLFKGDMAIHGAVWDEMLHFLVSTKNWEQHMESPKSFVGWTKFECFHCLKLSKEQDGDNPKLYGWGASFYSIHGRCELGSVLNPYNLEQNPLGTNGVTQFTYCWWFRNLARKPPAMYKTM